MRGHRYRAWQTVTKVMFYDIEKGTGAPDGNPPFADYLENEHMVVMEYTNFTDTRGQQMCEDDIVIRNGNPRFRYKVIFSETHGRWALRTLHRVRKGGNYGYIALSRKPERCEVIGNVHANPELLKVEGVFD